MARADVRRELFLEALHPWTRADPARAQGLDDLLNLFLTEARNAERQEGRSNRLASFAGQLSAGHGLSPFPDAVLEGFFPEQSPLQSQDATPGFAGRGH